MTVSVYLRVMLSSAMELQHAVIIQMKRDVVSSQLLCPWKTVIWTWD